MLEIVNSVTDKINQRAIMISIPFHVLFHEVILKARVTLLKWRVSSKLESELCSEEGDFARKIPVT